MDLADSRHSFAGQMLEFPATTSLFARTDWSLVGSIHSYTLYACVPEVKHTNFSETVELVPSWSGMSSFWRWCTGVLNCPRPYFSLSPSLRFFWFTILIHAVYAEQHLACAYDQQSCIRIFSAIVNSFENHLLPLSLR